MLLVSCQMRSSLRHWFNLEQVNYGPKFSSEKHMLLPPQSAQLPFVLWSFRIVAMLERNGMLKITNVGDCGLKLIHEGQIIFSTSPHKNTILIVHIN
ncbi:unnamed protein product [Linum trigynum]|uniref:Protein-serine/threonine phosphatase n=1 Tax=Linum trigynum TaxID=586398 RepID=A0AAV2D6Q5_9ROSI